MLSTKPILILVRITVSLRVSSTDMCKLPRVQRVKYIFCMLSFETEFLKSKAYAVLLCNHI